MRLQYLSHYIDESTPNFGGGKGIEIENVRCICKGDSSNKIEFKTNNHFGTHIDFPKHFVDDAKDIHGFAPNDLYFSKISLVDIALEPDHLLSPADFESEDIPAGCDFLIVRTGFEKQRSQESYWKNNPGLTPELGDFFKKTYKNLKCIGFDFISASAFQHRDVGRAAHTSFLDQYNGQSILIIEDMKLAELTAAPSHVLVSPLLIANADGIQVTVTAFLS